MKWSHSLAVAAFTGLIGLCAAGFATSLGVKWYDVHAFEGAEGFVVAACAILGLIAGFVVGLGLSRLVARSERPSAPKAAAVSAAALVVTIVAITTMARILADIPPLSEGEPLFLMVEVQTPVGYPSPDTLSGIGYLKLRHKERGPLFKEDVRFVDDRWVIPGVVRVFTSRGRRSLDVVIGEVQLGAFVLPLPAHPGAESRVWSEWLPAGSGDLRRSGESPRSDQFTVRYRVVRQSEPLRTESIGPFSIETVVSAFYSPRWSERVAAQSFFRVSYKGQALPDFDRFGSVAVLNGPRTALLVQARRTGRTETCHLVVDSGTDAEVRSVGACDAPIFGHPLTSDQERFVAARNKDLVFGWVDRVTFDRPGLFVVRDNVLDTRDLTFRRVAFPEGLSSWQPPPFGLSPDQRSLVGFLHHEAQTQNPTLAVTDWTTGHSYSLQIDRQRMRVVGFETLDPLWLAHHFRWRRTSEGVDVLEERPDFVPLPYRTYLTLGMPGQYQEYWLFPAGAPLRQQIVRILVEELQGKQFGEDRHSGGTRVRVNGNVVTVATHADLVTVFMATGAGDPELMKRVAAHLERAMASGKYDALFQSAKAP